MQKEDDVPGHVNKAAEDGSQHRAKISINFTEFEKQKQRQMLLGKSWHRIQDLRRSPACNPASGLVSIDTGTPEFVGQG